MAEILAQWPNLTTHGWNRRALTDQDFTERRRDLESGSRLDRLHAAVAWLSECEPAPVGRRSLTSYAWKHRMEKDNGVYVTNGSFILAALILGVKVKPNGTSPNPLLGLAVPKSPGQLRVLRREARSSATGGGSGDIFEDA